MYKVLVVDDEIHVVSLITNIVDWESLDMRIVGTANTGGVVLNLVKDLQPNIIIIDVRMPEYDGITLMRMIREIDSFVKFIVISGHKRFEYAKSAMKYNVEDYLIKPICKEELEAILLKLKDKLDTDQLEQQTIDSLEVQLGMSRRRLNNLFMDRLLANKIDVEKYTTKTINDDYLTCLISNNYRFVILKTDSTNKEIDDQFQSELIQSLANMLYKSLYDCCDELLVKTEKFRVILLCNYESQKNTNFITLLSDVRESILEKLAKFEEIWATIGVGSVFSEIENYMESIISAQSAINARIGLGVGNIYFAEDIIENDSHLPLILTDAKKNIFLTTVKAFSMAKIEPQILELFICADEYRKCDSGIYYRLAKELHFIFYEYVREIDICKESYSDRFSKLQSRFETCMTPKELAQSLADDIEEFIEKYVSNSADQENPAIRIGKRYIMENYNQPITLSIMSNLVNLSSVYFSILFKREVGVNFVDYLNSHRIDVAKRMLVNTNYNINEISEKVGFQNSRYFSKSFTKNVGITPSEYKKRHMPQT